MHKERVYASFSKLAPVIKEYNDAYPENKIYCTLDLIN